MKTSHPMIELRMRHWMSACLVGALVTLASCEGATYVNQHFTNRTENPLNLGFRSSEAETGWALDTVWILEPGATHVHYAVDFLGKCHDCAPYVVLPYGVDSLWVAEQTLKVDLQDSLLWTVEVDEGISWIRYDQRLDLMPSYFE